MTPSGYSGLVDVIKCDRNIPPHRQYVVAVVLAVFSFFNSRERDRKRKLSTQQRKSTEKVSSERHTSARDIAERDIAERDIAE